MQIKISLDLDMYINVTAIAVKYEVRIAVVYSKKGASQERP